MTVFLDTNILVYQFDKSDDTKRRAAQEVLREHADSAWISTQVLIELCSALTRKLGFGRTEVADAVTNLDLNVLPTDQSLVMRAVRLSEQHDLSIFDALIVEAAIAAHCDTLLTEDLSTGAKLSGIAIVNPFA